MSDSVIYIVAVTLLVALAALAFWIARQSLGRGRVSLFQSKPRRLGVVEATSVDGRRRLLLVRRDNVEHLIMTGGPVDVLIETGIPAIARPLNGLADPIGRDSMHHERSYLGDDMPVVMQREQAN
jgi:hypothetical protein